MKKILNLMILFFFTVSLSACISTPENGNENTDQNNVTNETNMTNKDSLAVLSYLSGGILNASDTNSNNLIRTSYNYLSISNDFAIDNKMDDVNIYMDKLKVFMKEGTNGIGNIIEESSTREGFDSVIKYTVNEVEYVIYYSVDETNGDIVGILILDDVEYELDGYTSLKEELEDRDVEEPEDEDQEGEEPEDEDQEGEEPEDEENEQKMILTAKNGNDWIKMTYKVEISTDENEIKFNMDSSINGILKESKIKISEEQNEYKILIEENEDEYVFKKEVEEEGIVYKLSYKVAGVSGTVKIIETTDENGELVYEYKVKEGNREKNIKKNAPKRNRDSENEEEII